MNEWREDGAFSTGLPLERIQANQTASKWKKQHKDRKKWIELKKWSHRVPVCQWNWVSLIIVNFSPIIRNTTNNQFWRTEIIRSSKTRQRRRQGSESLIRTKGTKFSPPIKSRGPIFGGGTTLTALKFTCSFSASSRVRIITSFIIQARPIAHPSPDQSRAEERVEVEESQLTHSLTHSRNWQTSKKRERKFDSFHSIQTFLIFVLPIESDAEVSFMCSLIFLKLQLLFYLDSSGWNKIKISCDFVFVHFQSHPKTQPNTHTPHQTGWSLQIWFSSAPPMFAWKLRSTIQHFSLILVSPMTTKLLNFFILLSRLKWFSNEKKKSSQHSLIAAFLVCFLL